MSSSAPVDGEALSRDLCLYGLDIEPIGDLLHGGRDSVAALSCTLHQSLVWSSTSVTRLLVSVLELKQRIALPNSESPTMLRSPRSSTRLRPTGSEELLPLHGSRG